MYEMTLEGLLKLGHSYYAENNANWMIIEVQIGDKTPEIILNQKENFESKLAYYAKAYNENLTLKANPDIKIVRYDFVEDLLDYFESSI